MLKLFACWIFILSSYLSIAVANAQNITVYAAASLSESVTEIASAYNQTHESKITTVFAASSTLARQIARGAPADIYISANQKWLDYLIEHNRVSQTDKVNILQNSLVIAAPSQSTSPPFILDKNTDLTALLGSGRLATGNTDHVPVGIYAKQALTSLGLWSTVKGKLALSSNTRAALAFIERNAVPAGLIYQTDALASKKVKILAAVPLESHQEILYPMALVNRSISSNGATHHPEVLAAFQFFQSDTAMNIFQQYGFKPINHAN